MSETKTKNSRSPIWHYFEPVDVKNTKCLLCESTYRNSGNTTNLIDHLKRKHRNEYNHVAEMMKNISMGTITNKNNNNNNNNNSGGGGDETEIPIAIDAINSNNNQNNNKQEQSTEIIDDDDDDDDEQPQIIQSSSSMDNHNVHIDHNDHNVVDVDDDDGHELENVDNIQVVRVVPLPHARSEVWTYFGFVANDDGQIMDRTKVVCKICASTFCYSGNTTNFYSHLKSMHSEVQMRNTPTSKTSRQLKRSYSNFMDDTIGNDSMDIVGTSNDSYYHSNNNNNNNNIGQITIEDEPLPDRSLDSIIFVDDITQCLIDFLVTDCRPLCVLQGKGFQRLLRLLAPGYIMPDKQRLSNQLRKRYDELRKTDHEPSTMEKFDNL
ncbi:hypothetical protein DERP_005176 [Dermatophagoides pteronyssinus]|uniref:BED-type domain-containing protein n=1 Tax=Dermatophagoides pteronyssinus TaxID=6956 RepID=A0ABQ8JMR7_DERPT|nr:hypothetical protein DERP_005176 [Dermatophagoides pteronyssinus]